jgi:putative DNA primase/helicase
MRSDLDVPYTQKDEARAAGAKFDKETKVWYVTNPIAFSKTRQWADPFNTAEENAVCPPMEIERHWLDVPYEQAKAARRRGYEFDKAAGCWYDPAR